MLEFPTSEITKNRQKAAVFPIISAVDFSGVEALDPFTVVFILSTFCSGRLQVIHHRVETRCANVVAELLFARRRHVALQQVELMSFHICPGVVKQTTSCFKIENLHRLNAGRKCSSSSFL